MPVSIDWDDQEKTIICYTFVGQWTIEEYRQAEVRLGEMVTSVPYRVDVIADLRNSQSIPQGALAETRRSLRQDFPNLRLSIVITQSNILAELINALADLLPAIRYKLASNLAEARALIYADREAGPENSPPSIRR